MKRWPRARLILVGALMASVSGAACQRASATSPQTKTSTADSSPAKPSVSAPKTLTLSYDKTSKAVVGTSVTATAEGLPAGKKVDLLWGTVTGGWIVENYFRFKGKKYTEITQPLGQTHIGSDGRLTYQFTIPEDYGGVHDITVTDNGGVLAQGGIEVSQTFEMHPTEGPLGTPIEVRVRGLGWRTMESTWVVNWDNQEVGWVSAADTHGTAIARFRASGPVGPHTIKVYTGYMGQGYLNHEQAPNAYLPRPDFMFRVTSGHAVAKPIFEEPYQKQMVPPSDGNSGASASLRPIQGPVMTQASLKGSGLPKNADVSVVWGTQVGSRVTPTGFAAKETILAKPKVGADGQLNSPVTIPDDLGGLHSLAIMSGDHLLARTYFVVETSIVDMTPTSGPAGTPVRIHLKGVGWTDYDNIYVATYDNAYMGYACGFNSQGDVVINFSAAGAPGVHLIDFYPGIYQGPEGSQQLYRLPQLTYADDHPGNKIPALRFAFRVTSARAPTLTSRKPASDHSSQ